MRFTKPYQSVAPQGAVSVLEAKNVYYESDGQGGFIIRRRPGMQSVLTQNGEPNGLHFFRNYLYSISGSMLRRHFSATTSEDGGLVNGEGLAEFADGQKINTEPFFYIARGGRLQFSDGLSLIEPSDSNTPTADTITVLGSRFWANNKAYNDQDFYITGVNPDSGQIDPLYWSESTNPWRALQNADPVVKIMAGWGVAYVFGTEVCEIWQEDGVYPISPIIGATFEVGLLAKHSVVKADNKVFFLAIVDGKRCVVKLQDRMPVIISEPISDLLSSLATASDCQATTCFVDGTNFIIMKFPSDGRTFCYDMKNDIWTEWAGWSNGVWTPYIGAQIVYARNWNQHIVQTESGLSLLSRSVYTDNTAIMRASIVTGQIDYGTYNRKKSNRLVIKCRLYSGNPGSLLMRYRDNGRPEWSNYIEIPLSAQSNSEYFAKIHNMGIYRSRQYEFVLADNADLALVGFDEDVTVIK